MTEAQFIKNNTNVGDFPDMPSSFLAEMYNKIKENEIKMSDGMLFFLSKCDEKHNYMILICFSS
jgi:Sec7-like guanine-nucleotide exchange factor